MTNKDQCREAFEAHYCPDASAEEKAQIFRIWPDGRYFNGYTQARYEGWQAVRSAPAAPQSDEQIDDLLGEANRGYDIEREHYFKAFRDAEAAHNITGEPA